MRMSAFGVSIEVSRLQGNIYVNMMIATISECIGCFMGGYLVQKVPLRHLLVFGYLFMASGYCTPSIFKTFIS